jgi:hypothetical protein
MLDFRRTRQTKNYLGQREQRRMLALLVVSGVVLLAIRQVSQPANWGWLLPGGVADPADEAQVVRQPRHPANSDGELMAGAFLSPAEPAAVPPEAEGYFPGVRPDYLKSVRDDTFLRHSEQDAWFHLLEVLSKADGAAIERASTGRVSYVQLDDQPREYRGRLVTVRGSVKQVLPVTAPANSYGIGDYYMLTLQPERGPSEPLIVYCLNLPEGFPIAEPKMAADVELTGFFYKRLAYQAQDRPRIAPLILARGLHWEKPVAKPAAAPPPDPAILARYLAPALILATLFCVALYSRSRRRTAEQRARQTPNLTPATFQSLLNADLPPTTEEALKDLGRQNQ